MYPSTRNVPIDQKDFKTLVIRDLEDKPDLVNIIKDTMKRKNISAGGAAIEFIIEDYERRNLELKDLQREFKIERENNKKVVREMEESMKEKNTILKNLQSVLSAISKLKLP